jgi:hypothetical protein
LHGGLDPSWHTTVVPEFCGTTTVVFFAGGGGLLLLIHPDSTDPANRTLARTFMEPPDDEYKFREPFLLPGRSSQ